MKNNNVNWMFLIAVALIVAVVASVISAGITGNVIRQSNNPVGKFQVYTKAEIDTLLTKFDKSCVYVNYKNSDSSGKTLLEVCNQFRLKPEMSTRYYGYVLFNKPDCPPSYTIYSSDSHLLGNVDKRDILGGQPITSCSNAKFPNGQSNGNFSKETSYFIDGVLCC